MLVDLPYMDAMGYISLTNTASIAEDKPSILGGTKHQRHVNGDQLWPTASKGRSNSCIASWILLTCTWWVPFIWNMAAWSFCFFLGGGENLGQNKMWGVYIYIYIYIYIFMWQYIWATIFHDVVFFTARSQETHSTYSAIWDHASSPKRLFKGWPTWPFCETNWKSKTIKIKIINSLSPQFWGW